MQQQQLGGKFLTFFLDQEEYGIEILKVREIIGTLSITPVPRTAPFIRGVINLRGKVIPIMALRLKFGMPDNAPAEEACIIIVRAQGVEMGLVVDKVSEVLDIAPDDIDAVPSLGADVNTAYILGIGKAGGKITLLLHIDQILATNQVIDLYNTTGSSPADPAVRTDHPLPVVA